jgi:flagellar FliL protein
MSAKPSKTAAPAKADAPVEAPKKSHKMLFIIIAVLVLVIAGGAGWYFTKGKSGPHAEAAKVEKPKDPKFITLEPFTVNLQREESDQYLQIGISLKILEPELEEKIKAVLPEVRSKLLLLLSSKRASELSTGAGKNKLASEIIIEIDAILGIHHKTHHATTPAVSGVAEANSHAAEVAHEKTDAVSEVVSATEEPDTPPAAEKENSGIVDVLFTSFIIQ